MLKYYLAKRNDEFYIESIPDGMNPGNGFIRWTPEITGPDISQEMISAFRAEIASLFPN